MWIYDKKLQYPVKIQRVDPALAKLIITQFGGPDGELGASQRYLSQRYAMPYDEVKAILTDVGTEELAHMEMICAIVHQLTRNLTEDQVKQGGFEAYFVDHTTGLYPVDATGNPWTAATFQSKGDPICDLTEDLAAERGAHRKTMSRRRSWCGQGGYVTPPPILRFAAESMPQFSFGKDAPDCERLYRSK